MNGHFPFYLGFQTVGVHHQFHCRCIVEAQGRQMTFLFNLSLLRTSPVIDGKYGNSRWKGRTTHETTPVVKGCSQVHEGRRRLRRELVV